MDGHASTGGLMLDEWASGTGGGAASEMWYLAPGAAFFQNMDNNAVSMTAEGISVGGMDLLDYMAMDQNYGAEGY
jgi:hypothetical protein